MTDVQIPSKAVSAGTDVRMPVRTLLQDLNLLGTEDETKNADGFRAAFAGAPQSVAVIEAGATAAAKWWAAGLGASAIAAWTTVIAWWDKQDSGVQMVVIGGAAFVTAAAAVAIGHLLASDVRGRAAASVATIDARARLAQTMIHAAADAHEQAEDTSPPQLVALPGGVRVKNLDGGDEGGWLAVAIERRADGSHQYVVVKGSKEATLPASKLEF